MLTPSEMHRQATLIPARNVIAALILFPIALALLPTAINYATMDRITVTIEDLPQARACRASNGRISRLVRQIASHREGFQRHCDHLKTDHGPLRMPQSMLTNFGPWTRENMIDRLAEGCLVELLISGSGPLPDIGGRVTHRPYLVFGMDVISCPERHAIR